MIKTTACIEGMMCSMCEAHINDTVRRSFPNAKKIKSSHRKGKLEFLSDEAVDERILREVIAAAGYACLSVESAEYKKKGLFG